MQYALIRINSCYVARDRMAIISKMLLSGVLAKILLLCCFMKGTFGKPPIGTMRIVQGSEIDIEQVPWQVSLQQELTDKKLYFKCGGVIIGKNQVLTAAHCFEGAGDTYYVRAGVANRNQAGPKPSDIDYPVEKIVKHPEYHFSSCRVDRDIAFLKLSKPFKFGKNIQAIPLADADPKNGEMVMLAGWGKTNPKWEDKPKFPDKLHSVNISAWDKKSCHDNFKIPAISKIKDDLRCLSNMKAGGFQSTCDGDGGGPVVTTSKKLLGIIVGTVSSQITLPSNGPCRELTLEEVKKLVCNDEKTVSVYNSIVPHRDWIRKMTKQYS